MSYEIDVGFDDETADVVTSQTFFRVSNKYAASCIGHEKTHTSTMIIPSEESLNLERLAEDLGDIPILSVRTIC